MFDINKLYPPLRLHAEKLFIDASKIRAYPYEGYRSFLDQKELYAQGRTKPGQIVTNAKPGYSLHNYGLAIDMVFKTCNGNWVWNGDWDRLGMIGDNHGFEWGGNWPSFPDKPHFQMTFGFTIEELYQIYSKTWRLLDVWETINDRIA